jgi:hypothetical protein
LKKEKVQEKEMEQQKIQLSQKFKKELIEEKCKTKEIAKQLEDEKTKRQGVEEALAELRLLLTSGELAQDVSRRIVQHINQDYECKSDLLRKLVEKADDKGWPMTLQEMPKKLYDKNDPDFKQDDYLKLKEGVYHPFILLGAIPHILEALKIVTKPRNKVAHKKYDKCKVDALLVLYAAFDKEMKQANEVSQSIQTQTRENVKRVFDAMKLKLKKTLDEKEQKVLGGKMDNK